MKKILLLMAVFAFTNQALLAQCSDIINVFSGGLADRGSSVTGLIQEDNGDVVFLWEDNIGGDPWTNYDSKIYLTKINSFGETLWQSEFGGVGYDRSGNLHKATEGGYIFGGSGRTLGSNWSDSYIFKTDENGTEQWNTILGGQSWGQNDGRNIIQDEFGNILFYGLGQHHPGCSGYVFRLTQLTSNGEINWSHCFNESQWRGASPIYLDNTDEYLFGVTLNEGIRIIRKGQDGENTFDQDYFPYDLAGTGDDLRGKFKNGQDGEYLLISGNPSDCFSSSIIKFNAQNEMEWEFVEPCLTDYANEAIVLDDGSWLVQFYGNNSSYFKRISPEGEVLFTSEVITDLTISQMILTADNEIMYSGRYGLYDNGDAVIEILNCSELTYTGIQIGENCNNQPQGTAPNTGGWEYHDFYVPEGMSIDSLFADFTRPGYSENEYSLAWSYCQGCTEYNPNYSEEHITYTETPNLYNYWIDVSAEGLIGPGVARVIAPTNAGTIWTDFCYSLSETECIAPNPCAFNYSQGDLNCDGIVSIIDISTILSIFGSTIEIE